MSFLRRCLLLLLLVALPAQSVLAAAGWHCALDWRAVAGLAVSPAGASATVHAGHGHAMHHGLAAPAAGADARPSAGDHAGGHDSAKPGPDAARGVAPCCAVAVLPGFTLATAPVPRSQALASASPVAYPDPCLAIPRKPPRLAA